MGANGRPHPSLDGGPAPAAAREVYSAEWLCGDEPIVQQIQPVLRPTQTWVDQLTGPDGRIVVRLRIFDDHGASIWLFPPDHAATIGQMLVDKAAASKAGLHLPGGS